MVEVGALEKILQSVLFSSIVSSSCVSYEKNDETTNEILVSAKIVSPSKQTTKVKKSVDLLVTQKDKEKTPKSKAEDLLKEVLELDESVMQVHDISYEVDPPIGIVESTPFDYVKFMYGDSGDGARLRGEIDEEYDANTFTMVVHSETMSDEEAAETVDDIQTAAVVGNLSAISFDKRKRLAMWAAFNPSLLMFYHHSGVTGDVDYSRVY